VQKLAEADDKGMLAGREDRKEAKREAAAAKTEHEVRLGCVFSAQVVHSALQAAMREYEKDIIPERQQFEARNERKLGTPVSCYKSDQYLWLSQLPLQGTLEMMGCPSRRIG